MVTPTLVGLFKAILECVKREWKNSLSLFQKGPLNPYLAIGLITLAMILWFAALSFIVLTFILPFLFLLVGVLYLRALDLHSLHWFQKGEGLPSPCNREEPVWERKLFETLGRKDAGTKPESANIHYLFRYGSNEFQATLSDVCSRMEKLFERPISWATQLSENNHPLAKPLSFPISLIIALISAFALAFTAISAALHLFAFLILYGVSFIIPGSSVESDNSEAELRSQVLPKRIVGVTVYGLWLVVVAGFLISYAKPTYYHGQYNNATYSSPIMPLAPATPPVKPSSPSPNVVVNNQPQNVPIPRPSVPATPKPAAISIAPDPSVSAADVASSSSATSSTSLKITPEAIQVPKDISVTEQSRGSGPINITPEPTTLPGNDPAQPQSQGPIKVTPESDQAPPAIPQSTSTAPPKSPDSK